MRNVSITGPPDILGVRQNGNGICVVGRKIYEWVRE